MAREWIAQYGRDSHTGAHIRELYACTSTGELTAMESKSRFFPKGLAQSIDLRDRSCRTPWCDAPVRHRDHIPDQHRGGATNAANGAGLCRIVRGPQLRQKGLGLVRRSRRSHNRQQIQLNDDNTYRPSAFVGRGACSDTVGQSRSRLNSDAGDTDPGKIFERHR